VLAAVDNRRWKSETAEQGVGVSFSELTEPAVLKAGKCITRKRAEAYDTACVFAIAIIISFMWIVPFTPLCRLSV
jgi:hypothetical protein